MTQPRPVRIEQNTDPDTGAEYVTEWYVDPPPPEVLFRVTRDEWTQAEGHTIWRIYEIALDEGP
jgi:hypothetical protein